MTFEERFWIKVNKSQECWLWEGCKGTTGYGRFNINGLIRGAHRVSFWISGRTLKPNEFVLHKCDVKLCVRPDHLYAGTKEQNTRDTIERGQYHRWYGENSPVAKLSDFEVSKIREARKEGRTYQEISDLFGISKSHVWNLISHQQRRVLA